MIEFYCHVLKHKHTIDCVKVFRDYILIWTDSHRDGHYPWEISLPRKSIPYTP